MVGEWDLDLRLDAVTYRLAFRTNGLGTGGVGAGTLSLSGSADGERWTVPTVWDNRRPELARICAEVDLATGDRRLRGTLLLRVEFAPGREVGGVAMLIDEHLDELRGRCVLVRTRGPEDLTSPDLPRSCVEQWSWRCGGDAEGAAQLPVAAERAQR